MSFAKEEAIVQSLVTRLRTIKEGALTGDDFQTTYANSVALVAEGRFAEADILKLTESPAILVENDWHLSFVPISEKSYRATMEHNLEWFDQWMFKTDARPTTAGSR